VFSSSADAPRARRPSDVVTLLGAAAVLGVATWATTAPRRLDQLVGELMALLPDPAATGLEAVFALSSLAALALIAGVAVFARHRIGVARDLLLAAAVAVGGAIVILRGVAQDWAPTLGALFDLHPADDTGSVARLALVTAVASAAAPHLTRPLRRVSSLVVVLASLGALAEGWASTSQVVASIALGIGAAAVVHLVLGSPLGTPSPERVAAALADLGIDASDLCPTRRQPWGPSTLTATESDGRRLEVRVFGRDAVQAQTAARAWRALWFRDTRRAAGTREQQVEHEAFLTLMAHRAGVPVPEVVAAGAGGADDALLVLSAPAGPALEESDGDGVDDDQLVALWRAVMVLGDANIAHGALDAGAVVLASGGVILTSFGDATLGADDQDRLADRAEVLAATAAVVGVDRSLAAATAALGTKGLAELLPLVQSAALTRPTRHALKGADLKPKALRAAVAEAAAVEVPELVPLRRVSPQQVAIAALIAFAAWTLISQLAQVGLSEILDELSQAKWGWVAAGAVLCGLSWFGGAVALRGAVPDEGLPLGPTTALQVAVGFIQIAMPVSGGKMILQVRYLQRFGVPSATAVTESSIVSVAGFVVQVVVLLVFVPLTGLSLSGSGSSTSSSTSGSGTGVAPWVILLACAVLVAVGVAVVMSVSKLRAKVLPPLRGALASAGTVLRSGRRTLQVFGGNLLYQALLALALVTATASVGQAVTLGEALVVATVTSLFVGLVPVPGGVGVAEGTLAAGLTATGMDPTVALTAAIVYRMMSFYLPPIWGAIAMRWLTHHEYL
jgi:uncharacterized membrane protein YbhN (UPF0104 family)/tRNA A-37 threonylcarbamoyl transferase component Bud32